MRSRRAADSLGNGFEPMGLPAPGPDGALQLPPLNPELDPPPRLCEAGPCVHYHRFDIVMDAAQAIAGGIGEGGRLEGEASADPHRIETQHYCYPSIGIETDLGNTPVVACSRWLPIDLKRDKDELAKERIRQEWLKSKAGKEFTTVLDRWFEQHKERQADEQAAIEAAARDLEEAARARAEHTTDPNPDTEGTPAQ